MDFIVFHDIADIAGTDSQALGCGYGILGCYGGIFHRKEEVSGAGFSGITAGNGKGLIPLLKICTEDQDHFSFCNKRLVIAGNGKTLFQFLTGDIQNGI